MATLDPIETLRRVPFFAVLPPDEIRALAAHCVVRRLRRDEMLFAEGDSCGGLFVVQAGAVKQFKMAETGREQVLVTERAGSTVGELALFDGGNFPASAAAVEDSTAAAERWEEHTAELQSRGHLVCRLLLEKKNKYTSTKLP